MIHILLNIYLKESKIFYPLAYVSGCHSTGPGYPGALLRLPLEVVASQVPGRPAAVPRPPEQSWMESEAARTRTRNHMGCWHPSDDFNLLCHHAIPQASIYFENSKSILKKLSKPFLRYRFLAKLLKLSA